MDTLPLPIGGQGPSIALRVSFFGNLWLPI